jgi:hypothetical protein
MGYRSDVVCIMYAKDEGAQPIVNEWVRQRIPQGMEDYFHLGDDVATFRADQWKWYEDISPVKELLAMFAEYRETFCTGQDDDGYAQEFARVGEALDDTEFETYGYTDYRLNIQRGITID